MCGAGEPAIEANHQQRAAVTQLFHALGNGLQLSRSNAERLFHEYVFPGTQTGHHQFRMQVMPRGNEHRVSCGIVPDLAGVGRRKLETQVTAAVLRGDAFGAAETSPRNPLHPGESRHHDEPREISRPDQAHTETGLDHPAGG